MIRAKRLAATILLSTAACFNFTAPLAAQSQPPSTLMADRVSFDGVSLTATGNVEVFYAGSRLSAGQITYARDTGALSISGPIELTNADGSIVFLADAAEMDPDLRNGILTSARLVFDQQLQLAAVRIDRVEGRYTRLNKTVTSACKVCADNPVPLWQIRSSEVIHDQETRQLFFKDAQFRLFDVPVLYLPHLRMPDPTLERATGFLIPEIHRSSALGTGIEIPYFIKLGDHKDLTVTPFITTQSRTLKLDYRQSYVRGDLAAKAAISSDTLDDGIRGYAFVDGAWDIGRGYTFGVDLNATSDISYLVDYDIFDGDRLASKITLQRFSSDKAVDFELSNLRTLREAELPISDTLPFVFGELHYEDRITPDFLLGNLIFGLSSSGHLRKSKVDVDGMDVFRLGVDLAWDHSHIFRSGLKLDMEAGAAVDLYSIQQNSGYDTKIARASQLVAARLSYPMSRQNKNGALQIIEPIAQISWSGEHGDTVPNSDSQLVEFDEGNLFSLSRFSGADRKGIGAQATVGLRYTHVGDRGQYGFTLGRAFSKDANADFTDASGLNGTRSDWLLGAEIQLDDGLSILTRGLFDDAFDITKWETRLDLARDRYGLTATHTFVTADLAEDRANDINEIALDGRVALSPHWTATADIRHDIAGSLTNKAGLGVEFQNECTRMKFGVSRRFADTAAIDPSTNYSFSIGFGAYGNSKANKGGNTCGLASF